MTRHWNDPQQDMERKLRVQPELFLLATRHTAGGGGDGDAGELLGSAMAGYDGHRGSVYYLAVAPGCQRRAVGRSLMAEVERRLLALGCPKVNVLVRSGNAPVRVSCQCASKAGKRQVNEGLILIGNGESIRPRVMRYTSRGVGPSVGKGNR